MLLKLLFIVCGLVGVGLPFDTVWHYSYALIIAFVLFYSVKRDTVLVSPALIGCCLFLAAYFVPKIEVLEKSRILVENNKAVTPQEFINNINSYQFSQTADGYVQGLGLSRKSRDVSLLNRPWCLRSGYVNKAIYNFYGPPPNLSRENLPFVVCYEVNKDLVKHGLNGKGLFFFKNEFIAIQTQKNISFDVKDIGSNFYAFGADVTKPETSDVPYLTLNLNKSFQDDLWLFCEVCLKIAGLLLVACSFFKVSKENIDIKEVLLFLVWATYLWINFYQYLWTGIFAIGGYDGVVHGGSPYNMLEAVVNGDWYTALQSPEPIFYYMPGMRYVRFFEILIFGDAYPLQVTLLLFTPVIYYRFLKEFLGNPVALVICLVMIANGLNFIGLNFNFHVNSLSTLYGEGFAYACLMAGLVILLKGIKTKTGGIGCFGLFAIAVSIRPNMLFFVGVIALSYLFLKVFSDCPKKHKFVDLLGLSPLILIPLHNVYFGKKLVLLTTASEIPENMPLKPKMYLDAFRSLFGFIGPFEWSQNFIKHFGNFENAGWMALFLIVINAFILLWKGLNNKTGVLSLACLFGLCTHLFYTADIRYMHPYFLISSCLILCVALHFSENKKSIIS